MTSQVLAIFYLNDMDHFIKEHLHIKGVIRYQDDFVLFHQSKEYLQYCLDELTNFLSKEKLRLNSKHVFLKAPIISFSLDAISMATMLSIELFLDVSKT